MGWSCSHLAGLRMEVLNEYCVAETTDTVEKVVRFLIF